MCATTRSSRSKSRAQQQGHTSLLNTGRVVCFRHASSGRFVTTNPASNNGPEVAFEKKIGKLSHVQFRVHVDRGGSSGEESRYAFQSLSSGLWLCKRWESRALRVESKEPCFFKLRTTKVIPGLESTSMLAQQDAGGDKLEALHALLFACSGCFGPAGGGWVLVEDDRLRVSSIPNLTPAEPRSLPQDYLTLMDGKPEWLQDVKAKLIQQRSPGCSPYSSPACSPTQHANAQQQEQTRQRSQSGGQNETNCSIS